VFFKKRELKLGESINKYECPYFICEWKEVLSSEARAGLTLSCEDANTILKLCHFDTNTVSK
jgi:hypothetical protein